MLLLCSIDLLANIFEIITPIVLFLWFIVTRWTKQKSEYFAEFKKNYGAFIQNTVNPKSNDSFFDGGMILSIFVIKPSGYFSGQLVYVEYEYILLDKGDFMIREAIRSDNICYGKLNFCWRKNIFKQGNPFNSNTNRTYVGHMFVVNRLQDHSQHFGEDWEYKYKFIHSRESGFIDATIEEIKTTKKQKLPMAFSVKSSIDRLHNPLPELRKIYKILDK